MKTVLVVEDDIDIQEIIGFELENAGYQVIVAANADEAIALLEVRPDIRLVFTDVRMPGSMDGAKLAAVVRDRWPPIHIIVTSGNEQPMRLPANAIFIPKPYRSRVVVAAIQTFEGM